MRDIDREIKEREKRINKEILELPNLTLEKIYNIKCTLGTDINEHLPILKEYSQKCESVTEMGVRDCNSTFGLLMGKPKKMVSYDEVPIEEYNIDRIWLKNLALKNDIDFDFMIGNTLEINIQETDLLFIDTYHTYEQLSTELKLHGNKVKKFLIFHDTFGDYEEELFRAINEFLEKNKNWHLHKHYENCNGLTILKNKRYE